jgi:hypothetical protein
MFKSLYCQRKSKVYIKRITNQNKRIKKLHIDDGNKLEILSSSFSLADEVYVTEVTGMVELCLQTYLRIHSLKTSDFCLFSFFFIVGVWFALRSSLHQPW